MTAIQLEDVSLLFAVALMHAYQLAGNARTVGYYRRKHKIAPPEMNGPPELIRAFRAHLNITFPVLLCWVICLLFYTTFFFSFRQNDLEFAIPFQVVFWTSGICFNQFAAAVLGLMFIYFRRNYVIGYIEKPENRVKPFHWSVHAIKAMLALSATGIVSVLLRQYLQIDSAGMVKKQVFPLVGMKDEL